MKRLNGDSTDNTVLSLCKLFISLKIYKLKILLQTTKKLLKLRVFNSLMHLNLASNSEVFKFSKKIIFSVLNFEVGF